MTNPTKTTTSANKPKSSQKRKKPHRGQERGQDHQQEPGQERGQDHHQQDHHQQDHLQDRGKGRDEADAGQGGQAHPERGPASRRARRSAGRERMCAVTRQLLPETALVRIAISPDGAGVIDLAAKLPGRGVWLSADRKTVDRAVKQNAIGRSAGQSVAVSPTLADDIEHQLAQRCLSHLGLARRSGGLVLGFDQVMDALRRDQLVMLVEANDGSADGRNKIVNFAKNLPFWEQTSTPPLVGCWSASDIGVALGRASVVHVGLRRSTHIVGFDRDVSRLTGFRPRIPVEWAVKAR